MFFEIMMDVLAKALNEGKNEITVEQLRTSVAELSAEKAEKMLKNSSVPGFKTSQNEDGSFTIERAY